MSAPCASAGLLPVRITYAAQRRKAGWFKVGQIVRSGPPWDEILIF